MRNNTSIHVQRDPQQVSIMPLIDTFGPPVIAGAASIVDFRWEREWRKKGSLDFASDDVAFGICSDSEVRYFENLVGDAFPFIDPDGDDITLKTHLNKFGATDLLNAL
ncbi:MAG: hypothetical protein KDD34_08700 [Bdellovibrionales bacterium]|nr:hypothetical protein [Bdellovibrionales bacterium]